MPLVAEDRPLVVTRTFSKTWTMAASRLGYLVGPAWLVAELDKVVLPYHLDAAKQIAGRLALRFVDEMDERVQADRRRARAHQRGDGGDGRSTSCRAAPTSCCSDRAIAPGATCGRGCSIAACSCATARAGRGSTDCLRVTIGTPDENDAFLAALAEVLDVSRTATRSRATKETSIDVAIDLDGIGHHRRLDRHPVLRPHARPARPPRRVRPHASRAVGDLHIDTHHTVEDVAIALGEAFREALGDKAGVRRFASGRFPLDEALVDVALDLSGRPFVVWEVELPECLPLGQPGVRPAARRARRVARSPPPPAITLHVELVRGRNVHHIIEATFKGLARCLRDAVRVDEPGRRAVDEGRAVTATGLSEPARPLSPCSTTASATCTRRRRRSSTWAPTPA